MIRIVLLAYPRAWRQRYGDELVQLIDDAGLGWRGVLDVLSAGLAERRRPATSNIGGLAMNTGPARRHPTSLALVAWATLVPALSFVVGSVLAYQLDVEALHSPMEAVNQWLTDRAIVDMALIVSPAIALVLAVGPLIRFELRDGGSGREAVLGMRLRLANVLVAVTALAIGAVLAWHVGFESMLEVGR